MGKAFWELMAKAHHLTSEGLPDQPLQARSLF